MKNKIIMALVSVMLLVTLSACDEKTSGYVSGGTKDSTSSEENIEKQEAKDENIDIAKDKEKPAVENKDDKKTEEQSKEEKTTQSIKVYFSDDQAENLVERQIDVELAEGETLEMKVLESLKAKVEDETIYNAVEEQIKFNGVKVEDKIASVDISSENLNGSSTQESFLVDAVVAALTSLDSVDGVKFLVDGQPAETLMGHLEVTEVLTKDNVQINITK